MQCIDAHLSTNLSLRVMSGKSFKPHAALLEGTSTFGISIRCQTFTCNCLC